MEPEVSSGGCLLVLVLDANPLQTSFLNKPPQRLTHWLDSALAFINSHLLMHQSNRAAVVASTLQSCSFVYPCGGEEAKSNNVESDGQFEGFKQLEASVRSRLAGNLASEKEAVMRTASSCESLVAGGLSLALSYANRYLAESPGEARSARILVLTASGAAAAHYMTYMNAFFTAQKMGVPIDACILERDSGLLQQGADITGGLYVRVDRLDSLVQFLIWLFLPETPLRKKLGLPAPTKVDYRAACFCHRQLVDVGFVCSVCLSIFCKFTPICSTCHTVFANMVKKKKKKSQLVESAS